MRVVGLVLKGCFYLTLIAITAPVVWWLRKDGDSFEGDTYIGYDDDDAGEDVDEA